MVRRVRPEGAVTFTIPMIAPSVNSYVRHTRSGRHYRTGEATAFKDAVAFFGRGKFVTGKSFSVSMLVVLPAGKKQDVDSVCKLTLDGLADAGVFRNLKGEPVSDAHVDELYVMLDKKSRPERGRTVVTVKGI